jgi:hypothetical protein
MTNKNIRKIDLLQEINKFNNCKGFGIDKVQSKDNLYIAYILNKQNKKCFIKLIDDGIEEIRKGEESTIYPMTTSNKSRHVLASIGKSGRGKGLINSIMVEDYHEKNKSNKIYYICPTNRNHDENFNSKEMPYLKQIDPKDFEDKTDEELSVYFKNSLLVIDDSDKLEKSLKTIVSHITDHLLITGRKFNSSIFIMGHLPTDYRNTRLLIDELDYYIGFNDSNLSANRLLGTSYKNMSKTFFEGVKDSIWFFINFDNNYTITNNKIFFN